MDVFSLVEHFHEVTGLEVQHDPVRTIATHTPLWELRMALVAEEYKEFCDAMRDGDPVAVADAICDLIYVLAGTAVSYGLRGDDCFAEVHRSNMSKTTICKGCRGLGWEYVLNTACPECDGNGRIVIKRADGKILKPDTYSPADIKSVLYG